MDSLSEMAQKQAKRLNRRPDLPGWWPLFTALLVVGFVFYVFVSLISSGSAPSATKSNSTTLGGGTISSTPAQGTTATPTTSSLTTSIPTASGGSVNVPTAALSLAKKAGLAFYTTDFSGVTMANGVSAPVLTSTYPDAKLVSTELDGTVAPTAGTTQYSIVITVDPAPGTIGDRDRNLTVTVIDQSGRWGFSSGS